MTSSKQNNTCLEISQDLSDFDPLCLPDIKNRTFWESLPEDYRHERLKLAEEALQKPWPEILMSDYLRFSYDGNRTFFEGKYFTRRRMLTSLVMGECIEAKGRFLRKIIDGIYLILGETTWCLPAHNSYIRDTKQFTIPDSSRPVVDLFSGETAAILSVSEALLRPVFSTESPFISVSIDNALHERVIAPYLRFHFWWMGNGLEPMCNWTPWITQNVLLTAFTRPAEGTGNNLRGQIPDSSEDHICHETSLSEPKNHPSLKEKNSYQESDETCACSSVSNSAVSSRELSKRFSDESGRVEPPDWRMRHWHPDEAELSRIYESAVKSVHHFLSEYAPDGCCDEGAQYYSHAGLCLFGCLSILRSISENSGLTKSCDQNSSHHPADFQQEFYADSEKIRNIATYIMKVHVGGEYYVNFADCSPRAGRRGAREYLFGDFVHDTAMMNFAAEDYRAESWDERLNPSEENLWYHVLNARCHEKMMEQAERFPDHDGAKIAVMSSEVNSGSFSAGSGNLKSGASVASCSDGANADKDAWFPSTGLMVTRDSHYVLAAKAGDNADSHNHNDAGSFILYKDNMPFIIDLGVGSYTQKTFSKDRYDIWTMQSQYHNLPSFFDDAGNIIMEHDGEEYRATDVSCRMDENRSELCMELKEAYPGLDGKLQRSVILHKHSEVAADTLKEASPGDRGVIMEDHYDGMFKMTENIITYEKPVAERTEGMRSSGSSEPCYSIKVGSIGRIIARGVSDVTVEELPVTDERLSETWKHSCYRIRLCALKDKIKLNFI
ncbi:MAG: hypothetical protein E7232_04740 [Lachnospiraceae bacterium]|nr:hypothetical protein [Lachnospiraceae bacterium]